ncbi:MAG TPA: hypothetical protein VG755_18235 [Nannocystaceae bacterium]|nr:hypothetical protein [Nannocystaceae bacterium]
MTALRYGMIRVVAALAAAQLVATGLAAAVDFETIPAALLATLVLVPGIVATVVLQEQRRGVSARVVYIAWLVVLIGALWWWAEGDPIFETLRSALTPLWLFTGVVAWGMLRRDLPFLRRAR